MKNSMSPKHWLLLLRLPPRLHALIYSFVFAFAANVQAGTAVGNFSFKTQYEFDFRIAYPNNWNETVQATNEPNQIERWLLANSTKTLDHSSSAELAFLSQFPASNDQQLLKEIKRLYPTYIWHPIQNPNFNVGFQSDQVSLGLNRTKSLEFFFSSKGKVIRVTAIRDVTDNGATELDTILSTIRRPSLPPQIQAIRVMALESKSMTESDTPTLVHIGERFCYQIVVSTLQSDFSSDSLSSFEFQGEAQHWSFKSISWHPEESALHVCAKPSARFGSDGLQIRRLNLNSNAGKSVTCQTVSTSGKIQLACGDNQETKIPYSPPLVDNSKPVLDGPKINGVTNATKPNQLHLDVTSDLDLASGELTLAFTGEDGKHPSQILYQDQIKGRSFDIAFDRERLPPGFTRVESIQLFDSVGNVSMLKIKTLGDSTYTLFNQRDSPTPTKIKIISLHGEESK